jgi:hypothetical protein
VQRHDRSWEKSHLAAYIRVGRREQLRQHVFAVLVGFTKAMLYCVQELPGS